MLHAIHVHRVHFGLAHAAVVHMAVIHAVMVHFGTVMLMLVMHELRPDDRPQTKENDQRSCCLAGARSLQYAA